MKKTVHTLLSPKKTPHALPKFIHKQDKGPFNNYVEKMRGGRGQKMSVFVQAQGIKDGKILST